jgi:hypothetical protein
MKAIRTVVLSLFAAIALTAAAAGCDGPVDRAIDCQQICERYKDCVDSSYDVSDCADRCRDKAGSSDTFDQQADNCENCLDDRSCQSSVFQCSAECAAIVP